MSTLVQNSHTFSMGYLPVGTAHLRNHYLFIMLQFPELASLASRGKPRAVLTKEF